MLEIVLEHIQKKLTLPSTVNSDLKIGWIFLWVLSLTFFLSNFLWAERSRHVVKTGSSGLHSQGWKRPKKPWRAYRSQLRQDQGDGRGSSNRPPCSSNAASGWDALPASKATIYTGAVPVLVPNWGFVLKTKFCYFTSASLQVRTSKSLMVATWRSKTVHF